MGRTTLTTLPDAETIAFHYDESGNLDQVTPPDGLPHSLEHDGLERLNTYTPPAVSTDTGTLTWVYNVDRAPEEVGRADGRSVGYGYDNVGRLNTVTTSRGTTTLTYDPLTGQLDTLTSPDVGLDFDYDGPLVKSTTWTGPVNGSVEWHFDDYFEVFQRKVNGTHSADFAYDGDGLLTQAGALEIVRHPAHGMVSETSLGVIRSVSDYNGFGELNEHGVVADVGGVVLQLFDSEVIERDGAGRIVKRSERVAGVTTVSEYAYHARGWLTDVHRDGVHVAHYDNDANGNRTGYQNPAEGTSVTGTYDEQDRIVSYGQYAFVHAPSGEIREKTDTRSGETMTYEYDELNNLVGASLPDGRYIEYLIDGRNRRVGKKIDGDLVQGFLYRDQLNPVAELGSDGLTVVAHFVYGTRGHVPDYMVKGGVTYRLLANHLGSMRFVVNAATGAVVQRIDYDEFGVVVSDSNPGFQPFGFAGGIYDENTGLVRFGARDYDADVGRWTTKDPILFAGGDTNLYAYVGNDPVNHTDPSGLLVIGNEESCHLHFDSEPRCANQNAENLCHERYPHGGDFGLMSSRCVPASGGYLLECEWCPRADKDVPRVCE